MIGRLGSSILDLTVILKDVVIQHDAAIDEVKQIEAERDQLRRDLDAAHDLLREIGEGFMFEPGLYSAWRTRIAALLADAPPREETGE